MPISPDDAAIRDLLLQQGREVAPPVPGPATGGIGSLAPPVAPVGGINDEGIMRRMQEEQQRRMMEEQQRRMMEEQQRRMMEEQQRRMMKSACLCLLMIRACLCLLMIRACLCLLMIRALGA
jgi:hypothetical protein